MERRSDRELPAFDDALTRPASEFFPATLPPPDARLWRADAQAIAYRDWDDELVVFNDATGHTHHLAPLGRAVLLLLLATRQGLRISEIASLLDHQALGTDDPIPALERTLAELTNLELAACIRG
jgi:hypothetical protein